MGLADVSKKDQICKQIHVNYTCGWNGVEKGKKKQDRKRALSFTPKKHTDMRK